MAIAARLLIVATLIGLVAPAWAQAPDSEDAPPAAAPAAPPARVVLTPEAMAQISDADRERAREYEAEATQFFRVGRYKEAIEKFKQAHEITQDQELLYSIATTYQQLEAWEECVSHMERYVEKAPTGPKRDRAENIRTSCDARIERDQQLIIESDPPGARVFLDDRSKAMVGTTPFRTYVRPGARKVWVELEGYEGVSQEIEVQKKEPFRMNLVMSRVQNRGWIHVDCTVIDARVYIDGKNVGLTPFDQPLSYGQGVHQIVVERDGYTRFSTQVKVEKGKVARVDAALVLTHTVSTWRTPVGWTANVLGVLAIGGAVASYFLAEREYSDSQAFDDFAFYEKLGYGVGGGLLAAGTALVIWDALRDTILDEHRNKKYGEPMGPPRDGGLDPTSAAPSFGVGVSPNGFSVGFTF